MKAIMGRKLGMTRIFDSSGKAIAVTIIEAKPNIITQIKNHQKDGYDAVQIGFGHDKHIKKPQAGHLNKLKTTDLKYLREYQITEKDENFDNIKIGEEITLDNFKVNEKVNVTAISKGKGFAGNIKRHGFTTGPKTHGSCNYRKPGSIGDTQPARVYKGKRMAGHMGVQKITTKNLQVMDIDQEKNLIALKGSVPGPNKSIVYIKKYPSNTTF